MKTIGRILIILAVFAVVMGVTYSIVNAGGTSSGTTPFEDGERPQFTDGERLQFASSERPEFPGEQFEGRLEDGRELEGGGWMFGWIKNIGIVAVIVSLIAVPRSIIQKKKRSMPAVAG